MDATPEDIGLSTRGLEQARAYVAACVERGRIAGAVLLVSRHDRVAHLACVGWRDIEATKPMEPDTIFRIASMTKPLVSVGILKLVEAGKLHLDDPVSRYVPGFADVEVFAGVDGGQVRLSALDRPISVYDLLTHTSGLAYEAPHPALATAYDNFGDSRYALPEMMRRIAARPLAHQPGGGWTYGYSHDVLGRVIEVAADRSLDDYLDAQIFTPMGMVDSGFRVPPAKVERLARVYELVDGALSPSHQPDATHVVERFPLLSGGAGGVSTGPDYMRFARMLLGHGELDGVRLLEPETVELMTRNHLAPPLYPIRFGDDVEAGEGYGLGVGVFVESIAGRAGSEGTYEWGGRWSTFFWIDPGKELIGIFLAQFYPSAGGVGMGFWSRVCHALLD